MLIVLLPSCKQKGDTGMNHPFITVHGFLADNSSSLAEVLTIEYELKELTDYFGYPPIFEKLWYKSSDYLSASPNRMTISDVNERFPIECLREEYYTVYKVKEGGYFYVFWDITSDPNACESSSLSVEESDAAVYFTAYLASAPQRKESDFNIIKENKSTADDVAAIDPAMEINFLLSSRTASYSLLGNGKVMEVCYTWNEIPKSRSDLIVIKKEVISNNIAPSRLASIREPDLPIEK